MKKHHTITIFAQNAPGVLHRIMTLFTKRKINLESITASETEKSGISRITLTLDAEPELLGIIRKQINRIIEVLHVNVFEDFEIYFKELILIRIEIKSDEERQQLAAIAKKFSAMIVEDDNRDIMIELAAPRKETDELCIALESYQINELVRSGRVAMPKKGALHVEAISGELPL